MSKLLARETQIVGAVRRTLTFRMTNRHLQKPRFQMIWVCQIKASNCTEQLYCPLKLWA